MDEDRARDDARKRPDVPSEASGFAAPFKKGSKRPRLRNHRRRARGSRSPVALTPVTTSRPPRDDATHDSVLDTGTHRKAPNNASICRGLREASVNVAFRS